MRTMDRVASAVHKAVRVRHVVSKTTPAARCWIQGTEHLTFVSELKAH